MRELTGKIAVVTGAASGIGRALAEQFVDVGMKVVLADIDEARLADAADRLKAGGADVAATRCDTASADDVDSLARLTIDTFGAAHVLCNNAGIGGLGDAWSGPMALWDRVLGVNLYGVVHGIRSFLPLMTEQGEGHIVNVASMAGLLPMPGAAPYNASKHAVLAISEGLYLELKATGSPVEVSVVCPGWVKTRIVESDTGTAETPMANIIGEVARAGVEEEGIDPADVARQVLDAIEQDQFWVLTHPDEGTKAVERIQRAVDNVNPTLS